MTDMDGAETDLLSATHRALCEHGYADLTLQAIAAETDKSKATIHYYYDGKDDLFQAFLEYLYDRYADRIESIAGDTPRERLRSLLDLLLATEDDAPDVAFRTAMLEVRAQGPYDEAIREQLTRFDDRLYDEVRSTVADGVDDGSFDDRVDPDLTAEFFVATISGAHTRHVAVGRSMDPLHDALWNDVETHLLRVDRSEVAP